MAGTDLDSLLAEAQQAYKQGDGRKGARLVDQILKQDINHAATWRLLYRTYGKGQSFDEFQKKFVQQFYPDRVGELTAPAAAEPALTPEQPRRSLFARLFGGRRSNKPAPETKPAAPGLILPGEPQAASVPAAAAEKSGGAASVEPADLARLAASQPPSSQAAPTPGGGRSAASSSPVPISRPITTPPPLQTPPARPSGRKIQVLVVDDIAQTRETVIRSLRFQDDIEIVGTASNGVQAIAAAKQYQPDVIVMDVNMPDMDGITATAAIKRDVPHTEIIILTVQDDVDYLRKSMMAGARDFLAKPPMIEDLIAAIQRAADFAHRAREKAPTAAAVAAAAANAKIATARTGGRILTVFSPRGGIGCTMLTGNLAICLQGEDSQVALVDGNLQFGDLPILFTNVSPKNTIVDLAPRVSELDPELVDSVMMSHSSGVKILAPPRPERAELVAGPHFGQLLQYFTTIYPLVMVDAVHRLNEITMAALDSSDLIILIVSQDVPGISRMKRFLDLAPSLGLDARKLMLVVNQFDKRINITPEKLAETFKMPVSAVLPLDSEAVVSAVNRGVPYMMQKEIQARPIGKATQALTAAVKKRLVELDAAA